MRAMIIREIEKAAKSIFGKSAVFEVFRSEKFGDYSSNIALALRIGSPLATAEKIKKELNSSKTFTQYIERVDIALPGFINFWLSGKALMRGLEMLHERSRKKSGKIQVEFISANPTGELHIGHGRSAFYGDALCNILEYAGFSVDREYFVNDSQESAQIRTLGKTVLGEEETYFTENLKTKIARSQAAIQKIIRHRAGKNQENISGEVGYIVAKDIQKDNERFIEKDIGVHFDTWFSEERELRKKFVFKKVLKKLKERKLAYKKDGAWWLKTAQFGDDEDRVIIRSDGSLSYFLSDTAYHHNKFRRGYKKIIDIFGADHQGHVKRIFAAKKMLDWKGDLDILVSQLVTLRLKNKREKLSKRKGSVVLLKDLLAMVGVDGMRWFYLEKALNTHMEFDLKRAKKQSNVNPVYYVQYAHARIESMCAKAKNKKNFTRNAASIRQLTHPAEIALIKKIIQFPEIIEDITNDYQVQRLTTYAYEMARAFNMFYRDVRVLGSGAYEEARLQLAHESQFVIQTALKLLGISAPKKM